MIPLHARRRRLTGAAFGLALLLAAAPCGAQSIWNATPDTPGWIFTAGIGLGQQFDDNVALRAPGRPTGEDRLTAISPFTNVDFNGRYTQLHLDYQANLRRYADFSLLNSEQHRGGVSWRRRFSRRVSLFASGRYWRTPTTDDLEIEGILFDRVGSERFDTSLGLSVALAKYTNLTVRHAFQRVEFDDRDVTDPLLFRGGYTNRIEASVDHRLAEYTTIGLEYEGGRAIMRGIDDDFAVQRAGLTLQQRISKRMDLSAGGGVAVLDREVESAPRVGPWFRLGVSRSFERASASLTYRRAFVPSYGIGGHFRNEELRGSFNYRFWRDRAFARADVAYRDADALSELGRRLQSVIAEGTVGALATPWMRVEAFYLRTWQDSRVAGGQIGRNRFGVQVVTFKSVRVWR